jgi:hypothetical protein
MQGESHSCEEQNQQKYQQDDHFVPLLLYEERCMVEWAWGFRLGRVGLKRVDVDLIRVTS